MAELNQIMSENIVPESMAHLGSLLLRTTMINMLNAYRLDPDIVDLLPSSDETVANNKGEKLAQFDKIIAGLRPLREERTEYLNSVIKDCELGLDYLKLMRSGNVEKTSEVNEKFAEAVDKNIERYSKSIATLQATYAKTPNAKLADGIRMLQESISGLQQKKQVSNMEKMPDIMDEIYNTMLIEGKYKDATGKEHDVHEKGLVQRLVKEISYAMATLNFEDVFVLENTLLELKSNRDIAAMGHVPLREAIATSDKLRRKHYEEICIREMLAKNKTNNDIDIVSTIINNETGYVSNKVKTQYAIACKNSEIGGTKVPHLSPLVTGAPGTGKTNFITWLSKSLGVQFKGLSAAHMDENSFGLYPVSAGEKATEIQKKPETDIKTFITKQGIIFIDELLRASPRVLDTLLTVISEHKMGPFSIHAGNTIMLATNDSNDDSSIINTLGSAMGDRLQVYRMPNDKLSIAGSWLSFINGEYGELVTQSPLREVVGFITENPEKIYQQPDNLDNGGIPSPGATMRGWTYVIEMLLTSSGKEMSDFHVKEIVAGQVGKQMATEFEAYRITHKNMPTVDELLNRCQKGHLVPLISAVGATVNINSKEKAKSKGKLISIDSIPDGVMYRFGSKYDDRNVAQKDFDKNYEAKLLGLFKAQMPAKETEAKALYANKGMTPTKAEVDRLALNILQKEVTMYLGSDSQERLAMKKAGTNALAIYESANPTKPHGLTQSENTKWSNPSPSIAWVDQPELLPLIDTKEAFIKYTEDTLNSIYTTDMIPSDQKELPVNSIMSLAQSIYTSMSAHISGSFNLKRPVKESVLKNHYKLICALPNATIKDNIMSRINNEMFNCTNSEWIEGFKNYGVEIDKFVGQKVVSTAVELIPDEQHITAKAFGIILNSTLKNPEVKKVIVSSKEVADYRKVTKPKAVEIDGLTV